MSRRSSNVVKAISGALIASGIILTIIALIDPLNVQSDKESVYRLTVDRIYVSPGRYAHSTVTTYPDLMTEAACLQAMYGHIKVMQMPYYRVEGMCTNMKTGEVLSEVSENNPDQKNP
jgi:hypothetical protein